MKHKVGDTVTIRNDLKGGTIYDRYLLSWWMVEFIGYTTEITEVNEEEQFYRLNIDEEVYRWTDEMLESV